MPTRQQALSFPEGGRMTDRFLEDLEPTRQENLPFQPGQTQQSLHPVSQLLKEESAARDKIAKKSAQYPDQLQTFRDFQNQFQVDNKLRELNQVQRRKIQAERPLEKFHHQNAVGLSMGSPQTTKRLLGALGSHPVKVTSGPWQAGSNEISMNPESGYVLGRHPTQRKMIPIPRPNHISFAHEGKHILDDRRGDLSAHPVAIPFYTNTNEMKAIGRRGDFGRGEVTENAFREEAGHPVRYGHVGWDEKPDQNTFNQQIAPYQRQYPKHLFEDQDFFQEYNQLKAKPPQLRGGFRR